MTDSIFSSLPHYTTPKIPPIDCSGFGPFSAAHIEASEVDDSINGRFILKPEGENTQILKFMACLQAAVKGHEGISEGVLTGKEYFKYQLPLTDETGRDILFTADSEATVRKVIAEVAEIHDPVARYQAMLARQHQAADGVPARGRG